MNTNLDRYKTDLRSLIKLGSDLLNAMQYECCPDKFKQQVKEKLGEKTEEFVESLPTFKEVYQSWYSEAIVLVKQLLPDRLEDFVDQYKVPKSRKDINFGNYRIEDYLQGLYATKRFDDVKIVGPSAAIPRFLQQLAIIKAIGPRFESSIFDLSQLIQADLFDSELDEASELIKYGFVRAAGALAGVVLERHLSSVCKVHEISLTKKNLTISDYNNSLKESNIIEIPEWRFIQHLTDIRNICDHDKDIEPTVDQVKDLIGGVSKITKTLF